MTDEEHVFAKKTITTFLTIKTDDVFEQNFDKLPGAQPYRDFTFIPGAKDPKERVLLVAHADTVHLHPLNVTWNGNIVTAWNGLGADDRVGCAVLWILQNSGHSLLITDGEEKGGWGAKAAARMIPEQLSQHCFAIEVDRRGDANYVFYNVSTPKFEKFVGKVAPKWWRREVGSYTDIVDVCAGAGICGVNICAGYMGEHTRDELFFYDAWCRSFSLVERLLMAANQQFVLPPVKEHKHTDYKGREVNGNKKDSMTEDNRKWLRERGYVQDEKTKIWRKPEGIVTPAPGKVLSGSEEKVKGPYDGSTPLKDRITRSLGLDRVGAQLELDEKELEKGNIVLVEKVSSPNLHQII